MLKATLCENKGHISPYPNIPILVRYLFLSWRRWQYESPANASPMRGKWWHEPTQVSTERVSHNAICASAQWFHF